MTLRIDRAASTEGAELVAITATMPFDRTAEDLGLPLADAERLCEEAKRVGFRGEIGSAVYVSGSGSTRWIALVGAGASPVATAFRRVASHCVRLAKTLRVSTLALVGASSGERARFATEGLALTAYAFDKYKSAGAKEGPQLETAYVVGPEDVAAEVKLGADTSAAVSLARDCANEHPGACTPEFLAEQARGIAARYNMQCTVREEDQLAAEGFNLILAVGKGSVNQPRLIHLVYKGEGEVKKKLAYVGKGVTYDAGGYSMKPSASQVNMHLDMGGAAAVLGAAEAIGRTRPRNVEVHFLVPTAENLVSRDAYKVMEIVTGYAGISVEVLNTDAEGRLLLADALAYATELEPDEIVDCATLTGSCVVALGNETAGVFSNDDGFARRFLDAAGAVDESMWQMPLTERIEEQLKSEFADTKNVGTRWGGAISAGLFLRKFVKDFTWLHVDLAGPAMTEKEWEYINRGGTGFGVLTLHDYASKAE